MKKPIVEISRADLWAAVEIFVSKQCDPHVSDASLRPADDDLKALVPRSMPRDLLDTMMAVAHFRRGGGSRGRWVLSSRPRPALGVRVPETEVELMRTVQGLQQLPVLKWRSEDEPLHPRGRDPRAWAMKITMAILMGNYETLLKTDEEERDSAR